MDRHFLDYRNAKVCDYMVEPIQRMVEEYGAEYLKFDYNQDCGVRTDLNALTPGKGLKDRTHAFFAWVEQMHRYFPDAVFEGCSSDGLRVDHAAFEPCTTIKNVGIAFAIPTFLVGVSGFEPEASWTRTKRDTKLRHTPILSAL